MSEVRRRLTPRRLKRWGTELLGIGVAVLLVLSARSTLADHYHVPSGSMLPTVFVGDRIFVNKLAYGVRFPLTQRMVWRFEGPQRGDVVVLRSPSDGKVLLKRVVGLPGDSVEVHAGRPWINGEPVALERDGTDLIETLGTHSHPVLLDHDGGEGLALTQVPLDHYLVLGDNRGDSTDGRSFGFVRREAILGQTVAVFVREGSPTWRGL